MLRLSTLDGETRARERGPCLFNYIPSSREDKTRLSRFPPTILLKEADGADRSCASRDQR